MTPAVVRQLRHRAGPPVPALDDVPLLMPPLAAGPHVRLVLAPPGPVPPGAVVVGQLLAVPAAPDPEPGVPGAALTPTEPAAAPGPGAGALVDPAGRRVLVDGTELSLTRREFDLLAHLTGHPGRVFTRAQLLDSVWDLPDGAPQPPRTVDVHVSRLRRKLGRHGHHLQSLRGVGYRWSDRPAAAAGSDHARSDRGGGDR